MAELILLGVFVAGVVVLVAAASRRQRLHGGSRRPVGNLGKKNPPHKDWWFGQPRPPERQRRWRV
jgi:hypothetical protein